jgi:hypothetical protein
MRNLIVVLVILLGAALVSPAVSYACTEIPPTPLPTNTPNKVAYIAPLPTSTPYPTPMSAADRFATQVAEADFIASGEVEPFNHEANSREYVVKVDKVYKGERSRAVKFSYAYNPCAYASIVVPTPGDQVVIFWQDGDTYLDNHEMVLYTNELTGEIVNITGAAPRPVGMPIILTLLIGNVVLWSGVIGWRVVRSK